MKEQEEEEEEQKQMGRERVKTLKNLRLLNQLLERAMLRLLKPRAKRFHLIIASGN